MYQQPPELDVSIQRAKQKLKDRFEPALESNIITEPQKHRLPLKAGLLVLAIGFGVLGTVCCLVPWPSDYLFNLLGDLTTFAIGGALFIAAILV